MFAKIFKIIWLLIPMFGAVVMWYIYQDAFWLVVLLWCRPSSSHIH